MERRYKILTYNIRHGLGMDGRLDLERVASVVKSHSPDVVALQEIDKCTGRVNGCDEPAKLASLLSPADKYTFAASIPYDGGEYGNLMLSAEEPVFGKIYTMPGKHETRTMIYTEFENFAVSNAHLSLHDPFRMRAFPLYRELARNAKKPTFFVGDWNAEPDNGFIMSLRDELVFLSDTDIKTFPSDNPQICIDYIAIDKKHSGAVKSVSVEVIDDQITSDHRPLLITFEL